MTLTREHVRKAVDTYIRAWETQDPELIVTIFTPEATYHERVLRDPIPDRDAIREYWETKVVRDQANIRCVLLALYIDGDTAVVGAARIGIAGLAVTAEGEAGITQRQAVAERIALGHRVLAEWRRGIVGTCRSAADGKDSVRRSPLVARNIALIQFFFQIHLQRGRSPTSAAPHFFCF